MIENKKHTECELTAWKRYFFLALGTLLFLAFINGFILASFDIKINAFYGELIWGLVSAWLAVGGLSVVSDYSRHRINLMGGAQRGNDL
jgi:hypothetical protein